MSRWIRPKYNEQCKQNAEFSKKSVLIDSGKAQVGYWLGILKEKCPEGLGKTCEHLKNNQDLVPKDFLDDEDAFLPKEAATVKYPGCDEQNDSFAKTPRRLSAKNDDVKQDVLSVVPGEQEDNNGLLEYGFKTPVLLKHNASISCITSTPCLFSPELLSQATQDVISNDHELNGTPCKSETISRLLQAETSSSAFQSQFASVHSSQENVQERSPDILALMVADNRPRSSLALLSAASSDDEIDGWSDSMATPPVQWSQSQEGPKEDVEGQKKSNEKQVARTLFEGQTNQDMSSEMSGFSAIESGDEQNDTLSKTLLHMDKPDVVKLGRIFHQKSSSKDGSLLKIIDEMENTSLSLSHISDLASSAILQTERTEFSRKRSNCSCKENECTGCIDKRETPVVENKFGEDVEWNGDSQSFSSLLSQPTLSNRLHPTKTTTSPIAYSQEVQMFMDLVQSTPKIPENKVEKKRSMIRAVKCDKNNTLGNPPFFLSRSVLLGDEDGNDSNATRSSLVLEHDSILCSELTTPVLQKPSASASSSPLREAEAQDVTSETHISGADNNSLSFQMFKTSAINESISTPSSFPKGNNAQVLVLEPHLVCEANQSLNISLAPRLPFSSSSVDGSKPRCVDEANDVSFGSISTSLEKAMVEEAEKVLTKTTESSSDKKKGEQLSKADVHGNASKVKELDPGKQKQVNTETNKPEREKKSPTLLLGVKRSSRSKRFSYPAARKPIVSKNSMECKVKKNEVDDTICNLPKSGEEKAENGRSDIMMRKVNEREKETRRMEQVGRGSEPQASEEETSDLNSSCTKQHDIHGPGNENDREGGIGNESGFHQTSCNKNQQVSIACNIIPSEILDLKNASAENLKLNLENISTGSEDYFSEDMTDNTLISIQEDFKTLQKMTPTEMLYDMDSLSQFPVELLSPMQSNPCGYLIKPAGCKEFGRMVSNANVSAMTGCKTAGCNGVSIAEEAMKKAKAAFELENRETNENTEASKISKFKTAGGKHVSISEEAIKKAKEMFEMENTEIDRKVGNIQMSKILGLKTDGRKDISISKKVTKKAKVMANVENREDNRKVDNAKATMSGLKTAGEIRASIFEQAKKKAKEMFKTRKIETDRIMKAPMMSGFKTAGGKDVSISEDAMKKAKAMFEIENGENDGKVVNTKAPMMSGFKTAGGKDVSISEDAMKKAKAMFEIENGENDGKVVNTKAPMMSGFKTAGGKDVSISEDAMKKAKAMFEIENGENDGKVVNTKAPMMSGFKTAGGKDVSISEDAMKKAKAMFEIENGENDGKVVNTKAPMMSGFKTAGGKDVSISEDAMKKAKAMFEMENEENDGKVVNTKAPMMSGFKTAGGKDVSISEDAMKKAKAMFEMENGENDGKVVNTKAPMMSGFKTAGGKDVSISEDAMKKAKAMFEMENGENDGKVVNTKAPMMSGFKTAGGKDVSISEDAMKKAKAMFEIENGENDGKVVNTKAPMMSGFKTAGGKDVSISEDAMKKAKAMFEMENEENDGKVVNTKAPMMSGFKTAGGKDVSISEDAMKKAKAMFEMENDGKVVNTKAPMMSGFKTAGGKDVSISEDAMKKAKAMFEMENEENDGKVVNTKAPMMSGFKTAGGKDVSISEDAMKKAKAMFEIENGENDGKVVNTKAPMMSGFKTAGGKDVSISEDAMKKAKAMFEMENGENDGKVVNTKAPMMSGFKTAGGKDVSISEDAMKKAKAMFEMENDGKVVNTKAPMMSGFKTAGGKDASISEDAMKKAKAMFEMENDGKVVNTKAPMMSGFKTAGGKDVSISEDAMKKAKAMFEKENGETDEKKDIYDLVSEKNINNAKTESVSKERVVHFSSKTQELAGTSTASFKEGNESQSEQKVPLFKVLTPSKRSTILVPLSDKTTVTMSSPSPTSSRCTSIVYSTPIQVVDENLSREILESSAALIADDSFTNFSECSGIHCHDERSLVPSVSTKNEKTGSSETCRSEPQLSKREALMVKARRRSASFLSDGDRTNPSLQTRSTVMAMRSSPSATLHDRRTKMFSPPLKPLVVSPNMSRTMSSFHPAKREAKRLFAKKGNSLSPATTSPTQPFPLAAEGPSTVNQRLHTTAHTGIPGRQFTTPYKSTSPLSNPTQPSHKEEGNCSPERKRARILGPANNRRSGTKPDNLGRKSVKPKMGYLFRLRQNSTRMNMKKYVDDALPGRYTEQELRDLCVMDDVMTVSSHNAESYRFLAWRFFSKETCESNQGIRTEDGGLLFVGGDGRIGVEEMEKALSTTPGVDVTLIPHGWLANHYRWIVWKLAAMETAFPRHFAGRCLTPDWVLCQLKYRYDREVDRSHRSALKKILERDDLSSRTIILCVSSLTARERDTDDRHSSGAAVHELSSVIELTDGWYSVNAVLDAPLTNLVTKGDIFEGLKLCINGAELVGSNQAVSPLEAPSSLMLRISANSTRRARWNSRLGFHSYSHPYPLPLSSLYPNGGAIGCVDVVVLRQYPAEYMEKLSNGTTVFRNSRAEEREAKRFARDLNRAREAVFAKVQREFEEETNKSDVRSSKKARSFSPKDISKLRNPKELYDAYSSASDPSFFEECLDNDQKKSFEDYRRISLDNRRAELENMFQRAWDKDDQNISKRTVVPMLKVRLVNYLKSNDRTEAILSIWRPNEDVVQLLVEGSRLRIYHLIASGSRYRQGLPSLQFSSTRSTRYKTMTIDHDITDHLYNQRKTTSLDELQTNPPALYSEVDLVGVIVSVTSHNSSSLQTVYISDEDHYLVSIKFWGGLKTYALDDLVKPRSLVACTNLVVRSSEHTSCPTLAFNELSTLTLKPREPYLRTALFYLNNNVQDMDMFMDIAQGSLDKICRPDGILNMNRDSPEEHNTTKSLKTEREISPRQFDSAPGCGQPVTRDKDLPTPVSRPFRSQCKRKLLESIPEPPSTPSINVSVSDSVRRDFKRPRKLPTGIPQ